jgi:hypothetical protein
MPENYILCQKSYIYIYISFEKQNNIYIYILLVLRQNPLNINFLGSF